MSNTEKVDQLLDRILERCDLVDAPTIGIEEDTKLALSLLEKVVEEMAECHTSNLHLQERIWELEKIGNPPTDFSACDCHSVPGDSKICKVHLPRDYHYFLEGMNAGKGFWEDEIYMKEIEDPERRNKMADKEHNFIDEFTEMMKIKYDQHVDKKGHSWKDCDLDYLYDKLREEFTEIDILLRRMGDEEEPPTFKDFQSELTDLALVAAMCWAREKENLINTMAEKWMGPEESE